MHCAKTLSAVVAAVSAISAQIVNISGTVTDTAGVAISGALVALENGGQKATTGPNGSFTLTGLAGIGSRIGQPRQNRVSARMHDGLLCVNIAAKSALEIAIFDPSGSTLSTVRRTMDGGSHTVALRQRGAGVYVYRIRAGNDEIVLRGSSIGGASQQTDVAAQGPSSHNALQKVIRVTAVISDVISVTKPGYLDYRVTVTNSDTSGIVIRMIARAGTVTDADGNVYQTVRIGNQEWTVENLRTTKYTDGSAIPLVTDSAAWANLATPGYCYYGNTTNADSIKRFGALYNWYTVNTSKLAPTGWHVPSTTEWYTLENYLMANGYNWDGTTTGNKMAKAMAAKADWETYWIAGAVGCDLTKNNTSGFSALPGGYRLDYGFDCIGSFGYWWSATENGAPFADGRGLSYGVDFLEVSIYGKSGGYSVRLVRG